MSNSPIDLSEFQELDQLADVIIAIREMPHSGEPLLVGAMARDINLEFRHGVRIDRRTEDIDLAFAAEDWREFNELRKSLLAHPSFKPSGRSQHKLIFNNVIEIDLIPFGGLERSDRTIAWPPDEDIVMRVLGLREVRNSALQIQLPRGVAVSAVSLPGLAVLKILAWSDRHHRAPRKDASDLWAVMRHYLDAGNENRLYGEENFVLEIDDYNIDQCGAWLLGSDVRKLLAASKDPDDVVQTLSDILTVEVDPDGPLALVGEMRDATPETARHLLMALLDGITSRPGRFHNS